MQVAVLTDSLSRLGQVLGSLGFPLLTLGVVGCSVYTEDLLEGMGAGSSQMTGGAAATGGEAPIQPGSGGASSGGGVATGGVTATGGAEATGGMTASGGAEATGGSSGNERDECRLESLPDPATLPTCLSLGHPDPADGDACAVGDDCASEECGFDGLGTKTCECKQDGTFNCSCKRPADYLGQCPESEERCTDLNYCVRGPSCLDLDAENEGALKGTRAAMHGDLCAVEWDQCVTVDAPASDGCVCLRVDSALPEWVCKDREGWFEGLL